MQIRRNNESYYQYRVSCFIRRDNGTEEVKQYELETDILYGELRFWNRLYQMKKSQNMLFAIASREPGIVKCKILQEKLVLIPRFTYKSNKTHKKGLFIKRLLLMIEMLVLLLLNMTRTSVVEKRSPGFYTNNHETYEFYEPREEISGQNTMDED